jgi:hypothetical protein
MPGCGMVLPATQRQDPQAIGCCTRWTRSGLNTVSLQQRINRVECPDFCHSSGIILVMSTVSIALSGSHAFARVERRIQSTSQVKKTSGRCISSTPKSQHGSQGE